MNITGKTTFTNNTANVNGGAIENLGVLDIWGNSGAGGGVTFADNSAGQNGGAIYSDSVQGGAENLGVYYTAFTDNTAKGGNGGAIETMDTLDATNDTFNDNQALVSSGTGGFGGAIHSNSGGQWRVADSTFGGNSAANDGGAIATLNAATITGDVFQGNGASRDGGAIANEEPTTLSVTDSSFYLNSAGRDGGAIENLGTLNVSYVNGIPPNGFILSMFQNNTAQVNGGAIDSDAQAVGFVGALNVSGPPSVPFAFVGNQAKTGSGGAINTTDNTVINGAAFGSAVKADGNKAAVNGGAVNATGGANGSSKLNVSNSLFGSNSLTNAAASGDGNAIFTSAITDVEISSFVNNGDFESAARPDGGAIAYLIGSRLQNPPNPFNSSLKVNQDYFENNFAARNGGAISSFVVLSSPGLVSVQVTNSTFYKNEAVGNGGGVDIEHTNSAGTIATTLTNDTFFKNFAGTTGANASGGGISLSDLLTRGTGTDTAVLTSLTVYLYFP